MTFTYYFRCAPKRFRHRGRYRRRDPLEEVHRGASKGRIQQTKIKHADHLVALPVPEFLDDELGGRYGDDFALTPLIDELGSERVVFATCR